MLPIEIIQLSWCYCFLFFSSLYWCGKIMWMYKKDQNAGRFCLFFSNFQNISVTMTIRLITYITQGKFVEVDPVTGTAVPSLTC